MENPAYQAFQFLHWAFVIAPVIAGIDKFLMRLANWTQYLWAPLGELLGGAQRFMQIVGVVEIAAGVLVAFKPKWGGYVVALWLVGIIVNLLLQGNYLDIALRDLGLALAAFAMARLANQFEAHRGTPVD